MVENNIINTQIKNNAKYVWIIASVVFVIALITLFVYKYYNPEFTLSKLLIRFGIVVVVLIALSIGINFYMNKTKTEVAQSKNTILPAAITKSEAKKIAENLLANEYYDYFKDIEIDATGQFGQTKSSSIYTIYGKGLYTRKKYCVLVNQNYPNEKNVILFEPTLQNISKWQNLIAFDPKDDPNVEITETSNPITQTSQKTTKIIRNKEKEVQENKEDVL